MMDTNSQNGNIRGCPGLQRPVIMRRVTAETVHEQRSRSVGGGIRRSRSVVDMRSTSLSVEKKKEPEFSLRRSHRSHKVRHVIGFRKVNRCINSAEQIQKSLNSIDALTKCELMGVELGIDQIEKVSSTSQQSQSILFSSSDKLMETNALSTEIRFMKENLEKCVRDSSLVVDNHNRKIGVGSVISQDWTDHNEFQFLASQSTNASSRPWRELDPESSISRNNIEIVMSKARKKLADMVEAPTMTSISNASFELEESQSIASESQLIETTISKIIAHHNVVTQVSSSSCYQARITNRYLTQEIAASNRQSSEQPNYSEMSHEKESSLESIANAKMFDKEMNRCSQSSEPGSVNERPFARSSDVGDWNQPVWAQSWADHPRSSRHSKSTNQSRSR